MINDKMQIYPYEDNKPFNFLILLFVQFYKQSKFMNLLLFANSSYIHLITNLIFTYRSISREEIEGDFGILLLKSRNLSFMKIFYLYKVFSCAFPAFVTVFCEGGVIFCSCYNNNEVLRDVTWKHGGWIMYGSIIEL